jgi:hypothetical protein
MAIITATQAGSGSIIPVFTWSTKPNPTDFVGLARITGLGNIYSDGVKWTLGVANILSGGIPLMIPPSASFAANGALTVSSIVTYSVGQYMYYPANAIAAGVAAGFYYTVMSSNTAGTVYNNKYTIGTPKIPDSLTDFSTVGPGAYTQTTGADIPCQNFVIPGGLLGKYGAIKWRTFFTWSNSGNNKILKVLFGAGTAFSITVTTSSNLDVEKFIVNAGAVNSQFTHNISGIGAPTSAGLTQLTVDTSADVTLSTSLQLATATDYIMCPIFIAELNDNLS